MLKKSICEVNGYENFTGYEICSDGSLISYKRNTPKVIRGYRDTKGYLLVDLNKDKRGVKIHRLVALAFIPNIDSKPQVNHKDGDKKNNNVNNLEWCTNSENQQHAVKNGLKRIKKGVENYQYDKEHKNCKKVQQFDLGGNLVAEYVSLASASRFLKKTSYSSISRACKGLQNTAFGYVWKFI